MRKILFRGKAVMSGQWHYGMFQDEDYDADFPVIIPHNSHNVDIHDWEVYRRTVGQYTGIDDSNGNKIFEGDILKACWGYEGVVDYDEFIHAKLECCISDDIEVIGNIYDNPELLEVHDE